MITFHKIDETFIKMECEQHVLYDIAPDFEFFAENYQYSPKYKEKVWDGMVRLLSVRTGRFYVGLLKQVILSCKKQGYHKFSFSGFENDKSEWTEDSVLSSIEEFKLPDGIDIREHQLNAILTCMLGVRRLIISPTSSGKSLIIYSVLRMLLDADKRILLIVPNSILVDQMFSDFESYAENDVINIEEHAHKIYSGLAKNDDRLITISTWQSIEAIPKKDLQKWLLKYDAVLVDEVHQAEANCLKNIIEKSINAKYRFGFTGTLKDCNIHELTLIGLFGTIKKVITIREMMALGIIAKLTIKCVVLKYPEEMRRLVSTMNYDEELDTIIGYKKRNEFIANLSNKLKGNTLIIIRFIAKHAEILKELIDNKKNRETFLITGETPREIKSQIRSDMEFMSDTNLMGSWGLVSTGMSVVNLNNGIWASPSKSKIRVLQGLGRMLRKGKNKTTAVQFDIVDDLRYEGKPNYLLTHFKQRYQYMRDEGFDIQITEVNIG